jgi:hypothetical protein
VLLNYLKSNLAQWKKIVLPGAIMASLVWSLFPLLHSGYFGDDAINSQIRGVLALEHKGLFEFTYTIFISWIKAQGRFYPLAWYAYSVFYALPSLLLYKAAIMGLVCLNVLAFGYLAYLITRLKNFALLFMLLLPLCFQFRICDDPILSYHFLMQVLFLETTVSLIFFHKFLMQNKARFLSLSLVFYACALLTYEISYLFFILYFVLAYYVFKDFKKTLAAAWPFFFVTLALAAVSIYLRSHIAVLDPGYTILFSMKAYFTALFKEIAAALPLLYYFKNPGHIFSRNAFFSQVTAGDLISAGLFLYLLRRIYGDFKKEAARPDKWFLLVFGACLAILPAMMICLSPKHQNGILGLPYLPVYIQYYGTALVLFGLYVWAEPYLIRFKYGKALPVVLGVLFLYAHLVNLQNNRIVVGKIKESIKYPRVLLGEALKNKLLDSVPEGAVIISENTRVWDNAYFYFLNSNKKYTVVSEQEYLAQYTTHLPQPNVYVVRYQTVAQAAGYVCLGKVKNIRVRPGTSSMDQIEIDALWIFKNDYRVFYNCLGVTQVKVGANTRFAPTEVGGARSEIIPLKENLLAGRRNGLELYAVSLDQKNVEFDSLVLGQMAPAHIVGAQFIAP